MGPLIVDTSVWIDGFRGAQTDQVLLVGDYIKVGKPIHVTPVILQEVLQGVQDDSQYSRIKAGMMAHTILRLDFVEAATGAAQLYRNLRIEGVTIRKPNDSPIAHYAIFYDMSILHSDVDFDQIARFTALRIANS